MATIRGICPSGIEKPERSVLVDGRRRTRGRELNVIVLTRSFDEHAELHRVIADDLRRVVRPRIHEAGP